MTSVNQDFTTYAGDAALPIFTVLDGSGNPIDLSTVSDIIWNAQRDLNSAAVLSKSKAGGGISFVTTGADGKFKVSLTSADTLPLTGYYLHQARVIDGSGNVSTVTLGRMQVGRLPTSTYSGDPSISTRDKVRFWINDTGPTTWEFSDQEIDYASTLYTNPVRAAAWLCSRLAAKYAAAVDKSVGDLRISYSQRAKMYLEVQAQLLAQADSTNVTIYIGGVSKSDMASVDANSDRVKPPFSIKQFDIPGSADAAQVPGDDCE